jgi:hypothetical protein
MRGGAVAVAVALDGVAPRVVLSTFLPTAAEGDRAAFEPYHVAAELAAGAAEVPEEVARLVEAARERQAAMATAGLEALLGRLGEAGDQPHVAALLVNRAGWVTDLLGYSLAMPDHPPVAEGLAVRDALRAALARCGLPTQEADEKTLPDLAATVLDLPGGSVEARLKALGATAGRPWRKEQKLACLAAWMAAGRA